LFVPPYSQHIPQAYVLAKLLYENSAAQPETHLMPTDSERDTALVQAIAEILWQAGQGRRAVVRA